MTIDDDAQKLTIKDVVDLLSQGRHQEVVEKIHDVPVARVAAIYKCTTEEAEVIKQSTIALLQP